MDYEFVKKKYIDENWSVKKLADEMNLTVYQLKGKLRRLGIRKTRMKLSNHLYDNREWLYNQYIVQKKGYTVIANS